MLLHSTFCLYCWKVGHPFHKGKQNTNFTNYMQCDNAGVSNHLWSLHCSCPLLEGQLQNVTVLASPLPLSSSRPPVQPSWLLTALRIPWENPGLRASAATAASYPPLLLCLPHSGVLSKSLLECHFIPEAAPWFNGHNGHCTMALWEAHCEVIKENTHAIWICKCTLPWDPWSRSLSWDSLSFLCYLSDAGRDWGQEEKGMTEDEMAGWYHQLNGCDFEWTLGIGDGQGGLACCNSWGCKELDTTEWLNWTEMNWTEYNIKFAYLFYFLSLPNVIWTPRGRYLCLFYSVSISKTLKSGNLS